MTGFSAPNYTQIPNDFWDMLPGMSYAELKVLLVLMRATFGYHRERVSMSIRSLARAAGLTPRNAFDAAVTLENDRGLIKRTVSPGTTTEFECVVTEDTVLLSLGIRGVSPGTGELRVKKRERFNPHNNKESKERPHKSTAQALQDFMERER